MPISFIVQWNVDDGREEFATFEQAKEFALTNLKHKKVVIEKGEGFDWEEVWEQETEWRVEEDDCGVLCLYDPRTEGWETLYDTCIECGVVWGECDCEDENECLATATQEQIAEASNECPEQMGEQIDY